MSRPYALYNEIDPYCAEWLRNLIKAGLIMDGEVDERSIADLTPQEVVGFRRFHTFAGVGVWDFALRCAGWPEDRPVWTGSCPCQPFSPAGRGEGFADERHLWPAWHHLIAECRPSEVFGEQVDGKPAAAWLDLVHSDLEAAGYAFGAAIFPAASVGAPHRRHRTYFVADAAGAGRRHQRQNCVSADCLEALRTGEEKSGRRGATRELAQPLGARLEGHGRDGDDGRQSGRLGAEPGRSVAEAGGGVGGMADDGRFRIRSGQPRGLAGASGADEGAARERERIRPDTEHGGARGSAGGIGHNAYRPGPTNGFWRDPDWLFCRDGKWRPVEPGYAKVVDGPTGSVGYLRPGVEATKEEVNVGRVLQALRHGADAQAIWEALRGSRGLQAQEVLRSILHGESLRRPDQGSEPDQLTPAVGQAPGRGVLILRTDGSPSQPPSGSEPHPECCIELGDVVRQLSRLEALAELRSEYRTAATLSLLRIAIHQEPALQHSPQPVEKAWASLGEDGQDRIRLGFAGIFWQRVTFSPLAHNARARVGRLRAYGNAIVAAQAEAFISAYMSVRP